MTSPEEKWASRCLPRASTRSSTEPSSFFGPAVDGRARIRRVGQDHLATAERGVHAPRGAMDRVAFGHAG